MEPYVLPKLTDFEYKLLMLCKGKYKVKPIAVLVDGVFRQYPQFYDFYGTEYWTGETNIPYSAEEIERLLISVMSELLFKLSPNLFKACVLEAFGTNTTLLDKEDPHVFFKMLRSYIRLRISTDDYRYLGELIF